MMPPASVELVSAGLRVYLTSDLPVDGGSYGIVQTYLMGSDRDETVYAVVVWEVDGQITCESIDNLRADTRPRMFVVLGKSDA